MPNTSGIDRFLRTGVHLRWPRVTAVVRIVAALLFVFFGIQKFTDHARWVADFGTWGLPESSPLVYVTGVIETGGGLLLLVGVLLPWVAVALALTMVVAVATGGVIGGNPASLTLAPALLIASVYVAYASWPTTRRPAMAG